MQGRCCTGGEGLLIKRALWAPNMVIREIGAQACLFPVRLSGILSARIFYKYDTAQDRVEWQLMRRVLWVVTIIGVAVAILVGSARLWGEERARVYWVSCINIQVTEDRATFYAANTTSAYYWKRYAYRVENDVLLVSVYGGFAGTWNGDVDISGDFGNLRAIYIEDDEEQMLIWGENVL